MLSADEAAETADIVEMEEDVIRRAGDEVSVAAIALRPEHHPCHHDVADDGAARRAGGTLLTRMEGPRLEQGADDAFPDFSRRFVRQPGREVIQPLEKGHVTIYFQRNDREPFPIPAVVAEIWQKRREYP